MVGQCELESSVMSTPVQPLTLLVVAIASWLQRDQQAAIVLCLLFIHLPAHGSEVSPAARNTLDSARIPRASKSKSLPASGERTARPFVVRLLGLAAPACSCVWTASQSSGAMIDGCWPS